MVRIFSDMSYWPRISASHLKTLLDNWMMWLLARLEKSLKCTLNWTGKTSSQSKNSILSLMSKERRIEGKMAITYDSVTGRPFTASHIAGFTRQKKVNHVWTWSSWRQQSILSRAFFNCGTHSPWKQTSLDCTQTALTAASDRNRAMEWRYRDFIAIFSDNDFTEDGRLMYNNWFLYFKLWNKE